MHLLVICVKEIIPVEKTVVGDGEEIPAAGRGNGGELGENGIVSFVSLKSV